MKAIQERHKGDRPKQQEELMRFYKENKINPAASCLPILFQIPIFIALFFVLRDFENEVFPKYPGSELGWLNLVPDITEPATSHWSGFLMLAIYAISQTASTLLMPTTMDKTQRYILLALPIVFLFFVANFPSGLVLYWVTTNLWTVGQGLITRRLIPKVTPPAKTGPKRSSRTPPKEERVEDSAQPAPAAAAAPAQPAGPPRKVKRKKKARR